MSTVLALCGMHEALRNYTACDISDALLKLSPDLPHAGFLADISETRDLPACPAAHFNGFAEPEPPASTDPIAPTPGKRRKVIAPASTVLFVPKKNPPPPVSPEAGEAQDPSSSSPSSEKSVIPESNIPKVAHYVDLTVSGTIAVIAQPEGQKNAVLGGIVAERMRALGAGGVVVSGRVRDQTSLNTLDFPIWARGTSTVAAGAESLAWATQVPVNIGDVLVSPGDIIFADPDEGVVCIPLGMYREVLELLPRMVERDGKVLEAVRGGMGMAEAVGRFRK